MKPDEPRDHHYAPRFFLRNFAVDEAKKRITNVAKHGAVAIWAERSIENLGYERDFYVHMERGNRISVETEINRRIETPISRSDTWAKIAANRTDALDHSDKPILYALIRHLQVRTPHFQATIGDLAQMAADPKSATSFADEERACYAFMRANKDLAKAMLNRMTTTTAWTEESSPVPLRSSTSPVFSMPVPPHAAMYLPLPAMTPFQWC